MRVGIAVGEERLGVAVRDVERGLDAERWAPTDAPAAAAVLLDELLREHGVARDRIAGAGAALSGDAQRRARDAADLSAALGLDVRGDSALHAAALGEWSDGAARSAHLAVLVRLDDRIGVAIVSDGRIFSGAHGGAGELGHVLVDPAGALCRCGNRGCLETYVSAGALCDQLLRSHGPLAIEQVLALAAAGDRGCRRVLHDAGRHVGRALAGLCNAIDPDVVVVDGTLAAAGDVLLDPVRTAIAQHTVPGAAMRVAVTTSALGERAELLGALALAASPPPPTAYAGATGAATTRRREG
ncbi:MAG TPA: ROK family protein [Capillimicrobium sp.]|nr:ROK family protein [Capillimicrobium sp.]